jgi:tetratricopeptide (TPR) repeat protein
MTTQPDMDHPVSKMIQSVLKRVLNDMERGQLKYEPTIKLLSRQVEVAEKMGNHQLKGRVYHIMGVIEGERGHNRNAERYFAESLKAYELSGDKHRIATMLCCLGEVNRQMKNVDTAASFFTRSRQMAEEAKQSRLVVYNYCNEGQLWLGEDKIDLAMGLLETGLTIATTADWDRDTFAGLVPEVLNALAECCGKKGEFAKAWQHLERSIQLAREFDQVHQLAHAHQIMALLAILENRDTTTIEDYFATSRAQWEKLEAYSDLGHLLTMQADYWQKQGNPEKAKQLLTEAAGYYDLAELADEANEVRKRLA